MHAALPYLCPSNYPTLATPLLYTAFSAAVPLQNRSRRRYYIIPNKKTEAPSIPGIRGTISKTLTVIKNAVNSAL